MHRTKADNIQGLILSRVTELTAKKEEAQKDLAHEEGYPVCDA
jgi:hypothetical protein